MVVTGEGRRVTVAGSCARRVWQEAGAVMIGGRTRHTSIRSGPCRRLRSGPGAPGVRVARAGQRARASGVVRTGAVAGTKLGVGQSVREEGAGLSRAWDGQAPSATGRSSGRGSWGLVRAVGGATPFIRVPSWGGGAPPGSVRRPPGGCRGRGLLSLLRSRKRPSFARRSGIARGTQPPSTRGAPVGPPLTG